MKRPFILALTVLVGAPLAAEDPPAPVTLRGRVVDAQTGEPIAKALVSIRNRKLEAVTDAGGRFILTGVPPGEAEIAVARRHHSSPRIPRRRPHTCWAAPSSRTWPASWSTTLCGRSSFSLTLLIDELDTRTGRVFLENDTLLPFLPTAGVTVEF